MGEREQEPQISPSYEVISEQARRDALSVGNADRKEHGLGYILNRVKQGLTDAAKSLINFETAASVRDYLPVNDPDRRLVMSYIAMVDQKFIDNPDLERRGWEELWLPDAVKLQGGNVSRSQANRLIATLEFRSRQNERLDKDEAHNG